MRDSNLSAIRLSWVLVSLAAPLTMCLSEQSSAATKEVALASADAALAYCRSGKMPAGDIDYLVGLDAFAQYGPGANCIQQAAAVNKVKKALQDAGKHVAGCNLISPTAAVASCQSGAMRKDEIAYIGGGVDMIITAPKDGCVVGFPKTLVSYALCKQARDNLASRDDLLTRTSAVMAQRTRAAQ